MFQKIILIKDNEFKTINAEVLSQIAEKWLKAMEENNVEAILPKTKEELSFFEVWWYNLNLVKKFCSDNPNASLSDEQLIFGYYNEPFYVGNWFWQQKDRLKDKKFNEYQKTELEAIKVKKAEERNIYTGLSTAQRWLLAIKNDTVSDLLPASKSELRFFNIWWYNFSLVYSYRQGNEYLCFEPLTFVDGYYGEKFDIGSWLLKQKRQEANGKLFKEQIKALDGLNMVWSKNSSNYRTKKSDIVASKWLKAIRNNEIEKILPSSLGRLKKYDIWWYNFALVKKYLETSNNQNLNDLKTVIGYYGENALLLTQMGLKYPTRINEKVIKEICREKKIDYEFNLAVLKRISYIEFVSKIAYLEENNISLVSNKGIHAIFSMSSKDINCYYKISLEEIIDRYYSKHLQKNRSFKTY